MNYTNPSDYGNIELRRREQKNILKWQFRLKLIVSFILALMIVGFFFGETKDVLSPSYFFVNWGDIYSNEKFNTVNYILSSVLMLAILYLVIMFPSKKGLIRKMELIGRRRKNIPFSYKMKFFAIKILDPFVFYLLYPISYFVFNNGDYSKKFADRFYFRVGWFEHIEYSFFKESSVKVDGYKRAKELDILSNYSEFFSRKKGDAIYTCSTYQTINKIFKSKKEIDDLFLIIEGYLSEGKNEKYDKNLDYKEYKNILNKDFDGKLENFRCYNGIDRIYFSSSLIKDIIDSEAKAFREYMYRYSTSSRQTFTRVFQSNFRYIKRDKKMLKIISDFNLPNVVSVEELGQDEILLTKRIIELCEAYFRIVALKVIIGKYINLPAGTMVVKINDYSARMIVEIFDEETLIQIVRGKNDGASKDFKSDALVNMFLAAYNYWNMSSRFSFLDKMEKVFNFKDYSAELSLFNEINSGLSVSQFEEGYRTPTQEEISFMKEEMDKRKNQ